MLHVFVWLLFLRFLYFLLRDGVGMFCCFSFTLLMLGVIFAYTIIKVNKPKG